MGSGTAIEHTGMALNDTEGRKKFVELLDGSTNSFDAKSIKRYSSKKKPSWERQGTQSIQKEIRPPPVEQVPVEQMPVREHVPMARPSGQAEIRHTEEVEVEQEPDQ